MSHDTLIGQIQCATVGDTEDLAGQLAGRLSDNDWVGLIGPLGAGKSVFVRAMARALGVRGVMPSPTYIVMNCLHGRVPIYHVDCYRIATVEELEFAGVATYFTGDGICLVEWADLVRSAWPMEGWTVEFTVSDDESRMIRIARFKEPVQ